METWTDERVSRLTAMWERSYRASVIANELGVTRCAALGKLNRLGLVGHLPKKERTRRTREGNAASWARLTPKQRKKRGHNGIKACLAARGISYP